MKLASFRIEGRDSYGAVMEDGVAEASRAFRQRYPELRAVLEGGAVRKLADNLGKARLSADELEFLPPVPRPDKILCVGVNYRPHIAEMGREVPGAPTYFAKYRRALIGAHDDIALPPANVSTHIDWEAELAIVIGAEIRDASPSEAMDAIAAFLDGLEDRQ